MNGNDKSGLIGGLGLGLCLGVGLMYYLDPGRGRRRRALVRDQAVHLKHETEDNVSGKAKDLSNRARGVVAEARGAADSVLHSEAENNESATG